MFTYLHVILDIRIPRIILSFRYNFGILIARLHCIDYGASYCTIAAVIAKVAHEE